MTTHQTTPHAKQTSEFEWVPERSYEKRVYMVLVDLDSVHPPTVLVSKMGSGVLGGTF